MVPVVQQEREGQSADYDSHRPAPNSQHVELGRAAAAEPRFGEEHPGPSSIDSCYHESRLPDLGSYAEGHPEDIQNCVYCDAEERYHTSSEEEVGLVQVVAFVILAAQHQVDARFESFDQPCLPCPRHHEVVSFVNEFDGACHARVQVGLPRQPLSHHDLCCHDDHSNEDRVESSEGPAEWAILEYVNEDCPERRSSAKTHACLERLEHLLQVIPAAAFQVVDSRVGDNLDYCGHTCCAQETEHIPPCIRVEHLCYRFLSLYH
mmetsp:Transcript_95038/g.255096  ORF Transcript_95038/g.255096 Transcript_95038/m.255096 type:complete len:263 (+) Transcript_95038:675-1463(+)